MTTGRPAAETDATRGSCARALSERATSMVDTRATPFADRSGVVTTLRYTRSRDPDTTPREAIAVAVSNDHLLELPHPRSGRACLTVRDKRRVAMCHRRYREAGAEGNAEVCAELLQEADLPEVLDAYGIHGP